MITRSQYITVVELNEILASDFVDDSTTLRKIYESSELLKQHCFKWQTSTDYTTTTAPNNLKLATAYQVQYNDENSDIDNTYAGASSSVSISKTSESTSFGGTGSQEFRKIAPKANRYLQDTGTGDSVLITRLL